MTQSLYEEKHTSVASSCNENLQGVFLLFLQILVPKWIMSCSYEMIDMKKTLSAEQVSIYDHYLIIDEVLIQTTVLFQEFKIWALIRFY